MSFLLAFAPEPERGQLRARNLRAPGPTGPIPVSTVLAGLVAHRAPPHHQTR